MAPYASAACCSKLSLFSPFLIINKTLKEPYILDLSLSSHSNFLNPSLISASHLSRRLSSRSPAIALAGAAASPSYGKELAAAKKAASLAARLCQTVQKAILQSDVQSKSDKSPVTVTNYGSQALVSLVLRKELPSDSFSLVAEEDSGDLRNDGAKETLKRITKLVNDTLSADGTYMQSLDGSPPTKVHVSNVENPADASFFESFEAAHSQHDLSSSVARKLGVQVPPVRIDSQAKYGALSRGDGAIYLRFPHQGYREKIWDHAVGYIVVTGTNLNESCILLSKRMFEF